MNRLILVLLFTTLNLLAQAQEATPHHKDSLINIVTQYYSLNEVIFQANSTPEDIDQLFGLFSKDFTYIHPKYGGEYSRDDLYDGYLRNQQNGSYNGEVKEIKVLQMIIGLNAVAVEKKFIHQDSESEAQMTLFEFKDGQIVKITEFW